MSHSAANSKLNGTFTRWGQRQRRPFSRAADKLDGRGAELLFEVLTEREEEASVAIASDEGGVPQAA
jgi:hypothetical protein